MNDRGGIPKTKRIEQILDSQSAIDEAFNERTVIQGQPLSHKFDTDIGASTKTSSDINADAGTDADDIDTRVITSSNMSLDDEKNIESNTVSFNLEPKNSLAYNSNLESFELDKTVIELKQNPIESPIESPIVAFSSPPPINYFHEEPEHKENAQEVKVQTKSNHPSEALQISQMPISPPASSQVESFNTATKIYVGGLVVLMILIIATMIEIKIGTKSRGPAVALAEPSSQSKNESETRKLPDSNVASVLSLFDQAYLQTQKQSQSPN